MKKFKTFIIFSILVAIWASFFATLKFYLWWELKSGIAPDLQKIAGYMSLGWVLAYLVWWAFASVFLKKYYLFIISILSFIFISIWYFVWFWTNWFFAVIITLVWFLYWLWSVVKSIIISIEIRKTGLAETLVNALIWVIFVVFIIIGSIVGSTLFAKMGHNWYLVIMGMLTIAAVLSFSLDYDNVSFSTLIRNWRRSYFFERKESLTQAMWDYLPDLKYILKHYSFIIITSSFLWTISTIVSQASVELSVNSFWIETSKAAYVLLYSALWAIIGNFLSVKMNKKRWLFFIMFNSLFAFVILLFPFLAKDFKSLSIMAVILWIFFGISSNLVDSFLLKTIWDENKKEYWASTFWLVLSLILFCMMFTSSFILTNFWFTALMMILWTIILTVWTILYRKQTK